MVDAVVNRSAILGVAAGLLCGCSVVDDPLPAERVEILVPHVGQGSGVLVRLEDATLAFDAGPDSSAVLSRALRAGSRGRIDLLVLSHWDLDHVGGLDTLIGHGQVGRILHRGLPREPWMLAKSLAWCSKVPQGCHEVGAGGALEVGHAFHLEFSGDDAPDATSNAGGLVARLVRTRDGRGVLLAPGDVDTTVESRLVCAKVELRADILLAGHHGSRGSSSLTFLGAVSPLVALIQAGAANRYGHPHLEALERLLRVVGDVRLVPPGNEERLVWEDGSLLRPGVP